MSFLMRRSKAQAQRVQQEPSPYARASAGGSSSSKKAAVGERQHGLRAAGFRATVVNDTETRVSFLSIAYV